MRVGRAWIILADAKKPKDERIKSGKYVKERRIIGICTMLSLIWTIKIFMVTFNRRGEFTDGSKKYQHGIIALASS